jgi:hypothetical protein
LLLEGQILDLERQVRELRDSLNEKAREIDMLLRHPGVSSTGSKPPKKRRLSLGQDNRADSFAEDDTRANLTHNEEQITSPKPTLGFRVEDEQDFTHGCISTCL